MNVGLLCGEIADADMDSSEAIVAGQTLLPPTGWVSGRDSAPRSHFWYSVSGTVRSMKYRDPCINGSEADDRDDDTDDDAESEESRRAVLVELRGARRQTVVPPSVHPSDEAYRWHEFGDRAQIDAKALEQIVAQIGAASLLARYWPHKGVRHELAVALAGGLLRAGWSDDQAERFLRATYTAAKTGDIGTKLAAIRTTREKLEAGEDVVGWPTVAEILGRHGDAIVNRVRKWLGITDRATKAGQKAKEKKPPRVSPPYKDVPVEALPQPIGEYVRQGAQALGVDPAFLALPALAVAGSVVGTARAIKLKRGWEEFPIIWSALVADSGTLKSPAHTKAVAPLFRIQETLLEQYHADMEQYEDDLRAWEAEKKKKSGDPGPKPRKPTARRIICSDVTVEKLAAILEHNPRGTLTARDELAGWLGSFTRYKGKAGGSDLPNWLEVHRGGTLIVDRKTGDRPTLFIRRAAVSVCGTIQPEVLTAAMTPEFLAAGLAARLLQAMPRKTRKQWSEVEIEEQVEDAYRTTIHKLLALDFDLRDDESVPHVLHLSRDAKGLWVRFYNAWAEEQAHAEGELAAAFSKLEAYAARLALLHHVVTHVWRDADDRREVGVKSIEAGITLCRWFAYEARRIYATLTETQEQRDCRRLVEFIQARGGKITVKALQKANSRKYPKAELAEAALQVLVDSGIAEWQDREQGAKGGRPTKDCVLKPLPTIDDTDETSPGEDDEDGGLPTEPSDETQPPGDGTPGFTKENEVSSVSSVVGNRFHGTARGDSSPPGSKEGFVGRQEVSSDRSYTLVRSEDELRAVLQAVDESAVIGLDTETTGLDPRTDKIRLLSLATDRGTYLIECFASAPWPLFDLLAEKELVLHNGLFDLGFLGQLGFVPRTVKDTMLLAQLLTAGTGESCSLKECVQRDLGVVLDKDLQKSDWTGELSPEQMAYAAQDAAMTRKLYDVLSPKIAAAGLDRIADIENRCLPAMVWLAGSGVAFDRDAWERLAGEANAEAEDLASQLDGIAPAKSGQLYGSGWNWDSPQQILEVFKALDIEVTSTDDAELAKVDHRLATLLRQYRAARKKVTTYGRDWLKYLSQDGRVYAGWRQIGAASGRMACRKPNLQNLPRGLAYRQCFRGPDGRVLVKADYSQIELRIAAKITKDAAMLDAYTKGLDLHTLTAQRLLGKNDVTKADRQIAKSANFGLLYGMGAERYREYAKTDYGLELTVDQAAEYRRAFFQAYPGLTRWHRSVGNGLKDTRTLTGRRRLAVERFTEKLNTPVQGTGADGLKLALALLWERRDICPGAVPVLAVHDEIVVECDADQAEAVADWVKAAMVEAMAPLIDPVPVEVEVKIAPTWGG
jgi:DNA polymerase I-like protein with 3'-5' exonuclease and polymerase domains